MSRLPKWRYVEDGGDSLCIYQCLSCHGRFSTDRLHGWSYCPRCGVRWEGEHECRRHAVPRWAWDRYGSHPPWELVWGRGTPAAAAEWVILCRTQWFDEPWSDWAVDTDSPSLDVVEGSWQSVRGYLEMCRGRHEPGDATVRFEYRATTRRKANIV